MKPYRHPARYGGVLATLDREGFPTSYCGGALKVTMPYHDVVLRDSIDSGMEQDWPRGWRVTVTNRDGAVGDWEGLSPQVMLAVLHSLSINPTRTMERLLP